MSSQSSKQAWLVQTSRGDLGPFSLPQLQQLAQRGTINRSSLLRDVKSTNWIRAEQIPSIFDVSYSNVPITTRKNSNQSQPASRPPSIPVKPAAHASTGPQSSAGVIISVLVGVAMVLLVLGFQLINLSGPRPPEDRGPDKTQTASSAVNPPVASSIPESTQPTPSDVLSTEDLATRTEASVAIIETPTGMGSGFAVGDGVVVTNYHVIADSDADSINVYFPSGEQGSRGPFKAQLIAEKPKRDLALLHIEKRVPIVEIDKSHVFRRGQDVVIIGSPAVFKGAALLPNAVTPGVLSSETIIDGFNHYQLSLAVNGGNSGGPVFGMDAKVIGVVVSKSTSEDSISFCIPAVDLVEMIASQNSNSFAPSERATAEHNARRSIKAIARQVIELDEFINVMCEIFEENSGRSSATLGAVDFVRSMKPLMEKKNPELIKDYRFELQQVVDDSRLTNRQRAAIESLMQRHTAFKKLLDQPPPKVLQLTSDLSSLGKQFFGQLEAVDQTLELQFP